MRCEVLCEYGGVHDEPSVAAQYRLAANAFIDLARTFDADDWATPVPCTPGWTVRDVLSHVSGIPDDALAGRMDGVATDRWTASQVERNRAFSPDELLTRWQDQLPVFTAALTTATGGRAPIDCHSHEHDVRHALDRPGNRDSPIVTAVGRDFAAFGAVAVRVHVELDDGDVVSSGPVDAASVTLADVTAFELFRSRLGRRTREQVRDLSWSGADRDIDAVLDSWFVFGPAPAPIVE